MASRILLFSLICCIFSIYNAQTVGPALLNDLKNPYALRELVETLPRNSDILIYFHDRLPYGGYRYGYILRGGERRFERGTFYAGQLYVEGFFSARKFINARYVYETTRYTAGSYGYYPSKVEITYEPPKIPTENYNGRDLESIA